ncbi:MAG: hypothetical protein DME97_15840 [Verrucomicrobia bacterium]|nr:MAG: hypothetical protein DME97_15840 [Verrucomicrobiota bacterium]
MGARYIVFAQVAIIDTASLEKVRSEIQPDQLVQRGFPRPDRVSLLEGTDSDGEHAFHIYLVFSDDTPDEALQWNKIEPMISWVRDHVWKATGESRWPYVRVKRHKDVAGELG